MTDADREAEREANEDDLPVPEWPINAQIERERNITGILIEGGFDSDLLLKTAALDQPMNIMRTCMDDLVSSWGIDLIAHETLSRPARPLDLSEWSTQLSRRYPSTMLREGRQAIVWARVTIGPDGQGTACAVQSTLSNDLFNQTACELLIRYGRFEPALDRQMQPLASYWVGSIVYSVQ